MSSPESVTLKILDKEYRVACQPDEKDSLTASAKFLTTRLNEIKSKGSIIGAERIAIMAALNISHELLTGESLVNEYNDIEQRIDGLSEKIQSTISAIDSTNKEEAFV
jgi:cell division protein ZapA